MFLDELIHHELEDLFQRLMGPKTMPCESLDLLELALKRRGRGELKVNSPLSRNSWVKTTFSAKVTILFTSVVGRMRGGTGGRVARATRSNCLSWSKRQSRHSRSRVAVDVLAARFERVRSLAMSTLCKAGHKMYTPDMPELPEVETVVRELQAKLPGATITGAVVTAPDMYRRDSRDVSWLRGARVAAVERRGKAIVVRCEGARGAIDLAVHLGMTGQLLWAARAREHSEPHQHARWELADGAELRLVDPRRFGFVFVGAPEAVRASLAIGPDALVMQPAELALALRERRAAVKALLLDQSIVAGLGNIYVDELLFLARVHPLTTGKRAAERAQEIIAAARKVLARAIHARGTTLRDYRRPDGSRGEFQVRLRVYGRNGKPCVRCRARIRKIVVGQRGTHFCPRCQRAPRRPTTSPRR